jgi:chemotaxis protein MotD
MNAGPTGEYDVACAVQGASNDVAEIVHDGKAAAADAPSAAPALFAPPELPLKGRLAAAAKPDIRSAVATRRVAATEGRTAASGTKPDVAQKSLVPDAVAPGEAVSRSATATPANPAAQPSPADSDISGTSVAQVSPAATTAVSAHAALPDRAATGATPAASAQPDVAALAVHIAARAKDGDHHFDIRLDPPDFGKVDVRLSVTNDGRAQAHVSADKPQTLELLQRDQAVLHRALKDAGLDLSNNSLNFSLKGQERGDGGAPRYAGRASSFASTDSADATGPFAITQSRAAPGRLDIRI